MPPRMLSVEDFIRCIFSFYCLCTSSRDNLKSKWKGLDSAERQGDLGACPSWKWDTSAIPTKPFFC